MKLLTRKAILNNTRLMIWGGLAYCVSMMFAEKWWLLETLSNGRMLVLLVVLAGSALSLLAFAPLRMLLGLIVSAWLAWPALPYYGLGELAIFGKPAPETEVPSKTSTVSVLCFNIGPGNLPLPKIVSTLESTPRNELPDIILIIEPKTAGYREHFNALRQLYPHHIADPREDNFGMWLMSRHPITKERRVIRDDRARIGEIPLIDAEINVNGQTLRVLGAHPFPPVSEAASDARSNYLSLIGKRLAENESPTILMGDLNCSSWSPQFNKLGKLRSAAYGYGLQLTWKPFPVIPLFGLTIDHILISNVISVEDFSVGDADGSDHRPLRATLSLPVEP